MLQAFCDERGVPLSEEQAGRRLARELELDRKMRMFFRHRFPQTCAPAAKQTGFSCSLSNPTFVSV